MKRIPEQGDLLRWNEELYLVCGVNTPSRSKKPKVLGSDLSFSWVMWFNLTKGELVEYPLYHYNLDRIEIVGSME